MRQVEAPSRKVSPTRDSYTISSSSSPTRRPPRPRVVAGQEDAVQAAVRDRAARGDRHHPGVVARRDLIGLAVPDEARLEVGELVGRIAAGEHVEHAGELLARQVAEALGPASRADAARRPSSGRARRWRRAAARARRAGCAGSASPRSPRPSCARPPPPPRRGRHGTSGRSCRSTARRPGAPRDRCAACPDATDGGDSICTTRSMAPMSMPSSRLRGRHERRQLARPSALLDLEPLLARDAAVVRAHELLAGELVEAGGQPLGQAPAS